MTANGLRKDPADLECPLSTQSGHSSTPNWWLFNPALFPTDALWPSSDIMVSVDKLEGLLEGRSQSTYERSEL
jgi:hypothetical protein